MTLTLQPPLPASSAGPAPDPLAAWAKTHRRRIADAAVEGLRFAFYWRVSTEEHQDPVTSRQWQLDRAEPTVSGAGRITAEYSDVGLSRSVSWPMRPGAAALLAALSDPDRGFDAVVIGSYERAFFGNQFSLVAPLFAAAGVQLWMPEVGGVLDPEVDELDELMALLGILAKREVIRSRHRAKNAMSAQVRTQGRWVGGRVPYGYRLVDAGPHPNKSDARWGRRAHKFDIDPDTGPIVEWIFASRRDGHSVARITRALNDAGTLCPSAADRESNPHRSGTAWIVRTVQEILANPVYTGRMVWNRQRTDRILVDPGNPGLGHREVTRWNNPEDWVLSERPAHPAIVSETDFVAVQGLRATRHDARHTYQLTALLRCALCGRTFEGHWVHETAGYRCWHGHTTAKNSGADRPKNAYLTERAITAKLPLLHKLMTMTNPATGDPRATASAATSNPPAATPEEVIDHQRTHGLELAYDPRTRTLEIVGKPTARTTL
jgi:site-specific DNA recombinase